MAGCIPSSQEIETTEASTAATQPREEALPYRQAVPGCALQLLTPAGDPFYGCLISVKSLNLFGENEEILMEYLSEENACALPAQEGIYQITLTNLADDTQTLSFPVQITEGGDDPFLIFTEFTIPEAPVPEKNVQVVFQGSGKAAYQETQWDRSDSTLNEKNHWNCHVRSTYPVLSGVDTAQLINADIYATAERFMSIYTDEQIREPHYAYGIAMAYEHMSYQDVMHNDDGIFSIRFRYNTFWGESHELSGTQGIVYSLATGERITLAQMLGISEAEAKKLAKSRVDSFLQYAKTDDFTAEVTEEDIGFYVYENRIYLTIEVPVANVGRSGALCLETEWILPDHYH